jgi:dTDP-4-amino-4,6-dideoxygalactose transaminase
MADVKKIPFNRPVMTGNELEYMADAVSRGHISGDGFYTKKCHAFMEERFCVKKALLTTSCTSALEMAALLCEVGHGDEVIMPSFTFVSTANAFYLRGARPVFVDIRPDTLNIDETKIEAAITARTKAIVPVHYAGVACEMDEIMGIAGKRGLFVVEDAAQGVGATYRGRHLGSIGHIGAYSFHETKNVVCGEGGALLLNDESFKERAEIIREKGTDRSKFFRGEVDKYSWVDVGSSYLPSDMLAAFLYAQFENIDAIQRRRTGIFDYYHETLAPLEKGGHIKLPTVPEHCRGNGHMFYLLCESTNARDALLSHLKASGIHAVFHYLPLHLSKVGISMGHKDGELPVTESLSGRLLRLPFYYEMTEEDQALVVSAVKRYF